VHVLTCHIEGMVEAVATTAGVTRETSLSGPDGALGGDLSTSAVLAPFKLPMATGKQPGRRGAVKLLTSARFYPSDSCEVVACQHVLKFVEAGHKITKPILLTLPGGGNPRASESWPRTHGRCASSRSLEF
jgi:hypothetical protein